MDTGSRVFRQPEPISANVDLSGRSVLFRNVGAGWAAQSIFIVAGFIIPRMINDALGQKLLGVWDFSWSLVAYFSLVQIGVVSSINRYVAKHRAVNEGEEVSRVVSSVFGILVAMAAIVLVLTFLAVLAVKFFFAGRIGNAVPDAQWVVALLGTSMAVQVMWSGYGGVLTGCHRWDLHHGVGAGCRIVEAAGMVAVLLLGGSLPWLAGVNLCTELLGFAARGVFAYRVSPGLRVTYSLFEWQIARKMLKFGTKTFLPQIGELLGKQTMSLLIIWFLGPPVLALYTRPRSLIQNIQTFVVRYAFVLTPTASSLQAVDDSTGLQKLFVDGNRYGAYITLPMFLTLAILGGPILGLWMGANYDNQMLISIMAVAYLPVLLQLPTMSILRGMNLHGRPGIARLVASIIGIGGAVVAMGTLKQGILWGVASVMTPIALCDGIYVSLYARKYHGLPLGRFIKACFTKPILCLVPFSVCLIGARFYFSFQPVLALVFGFGIGALLLLPIYWMYVVPPSLKVTIKKLFSRERKTKK